MIYKVKVCYVLSTDVEADSPDEAYRLADRELPDPCSDPGRFCDEAEYSGYRIEEVE